MTQASPASGKPELRRGLLAQRRALSCPHRTHLSQIICDQLRAWVPFRESNSIAFYIPMASEVDIMPLLLEAQRQGKRTFLPRVTSSPEHSTLDFCPTLGESDLVRHPLGVMQPPEEARPGKSGDISLFLVPGVGFSTSGARLGFGKGYYDRGLKRFGHGALRVGVGFAFQVVDSIIQDPWDVPMDYLINEDGVLPCRRVG